MRNLSEKRSLNVEMCWDSFPVVAEAVESGISAYAAHARTHAIRNTITFVLERMFAKKNSLFSEI